MKSMAGRKTVFLLIAGLLWHQVPHYLILAVSTSGLLLAGDNMISHYGLALLQDTLLLAIASMALAIMFHVSNYKQFSRKDVAVAMAPLLIAGLSGLIIFSRDTNSWMLTYQVLSTMALFFVPVLVVPFYLRTMNRFLSRDERIV
ncbi:MAG TPA: hypothetical protein VF267_14460 [Gammaproteobacteria bacterium]